MVLSAAPYHRHYPHVRFLVRRFVFMVARMSLANSTLTRQYECNHWPYAGQASWSRGCPESFVLYGCVLASVFSGWHLALVTVKQLLRQQLRQQLQLRVMLSYSIFQQNGVDPASRWHPSLEKLVQRVGLFVTWTSIRNTMLSNGFK